MALTYVWSGQSLYKPGVLDGKLILKPPEGGVLGGKLILKLTNDYYVSELTCTFLPPKPSHGSAVMASWIKCQAIVERDLEFSFWGDKWLFSDKL